MIAHENGQSGGELIQTNTKDRMSFVMRSYHVVVSLVEKDAPLPPLCNIREAFGIRIIQEQKRRSPDSNRGITDLQSVALGHLATAPFCFCIIGLKGPQLSTNPLFSRSNHYQRKQKKSPSSIGSKYPEEAA